MTPESTTDVALFGSVFSTMPDGTREQSRADSRAGLARAVLDFRARGGTDINVIDPWLPKRPNGNSSIES